jgi:hypothetical protein
MSNISSLILSLASFRPPLPTDINEVIRGEETDNAKQSKLNEPNVSSLLSSSLVSNAGKDKGQLRSHDDSKQKQQQREKRPRELPDVSDVDGERKQRRQPPLASSNVTFLQLLPPAVDDEEDSHHATSAERKWWTVAAFPHGSHPAARRSSYSSTSFPLSSTSSAPLGIRLELDGTVELRVVGPGAVTLLGEQHSQLVREDLEHGMFDDDEHDAFEHSSSSDDDEGVDGIVFD